MPCRDRARKTGVADRFGGSIVVCRSAGPGGRASEPHIHHQVFEVELVVDGQALAFLAAGEDRRFGLWFGRAAALRGVSLKTISSGWGFGGGADPARERRQAASFDACKRAITSVIEPGRSSGRLAIIFW